MNCLILIQGKKKSLGYGLLAVVHEFQAIGLGSPTRSPALRRFGRMNFQSGRCHKRREIKNKNPKHGFHFSEIIKSILISLNQPGLGLWGRPRQPRPAARVPHENLKMALEELLGI
jgi:hypothetical protein